MFDARQIANWFVERAARDGRRLTIMQLLKLSYISHGWYMEMAGGPLFRNKIEAWKFGPVIPDVYRSFPKDGTAVTGVVSFFQSPSDSYTTSILEQIYSIYGKMPASRLSEITHVTDGPWDIASKRFGYFAPITNDIILSHYQKLRADGVAGENERRQTTG